MFIDCFALKDIYLNNVINIDMFLSDQHIKYHISRRLTGFGQMTILNTRAVINTTYWKPEVNNTLVLLTCRCSKAFHSVLKHAYHPIGIQFSETRYNNCSYNPLSTYVVSLTVSCIKEYFECEIDIKLSKYRAKFKYVINF